MHKKHVWGNLAGVLRRVTNYVAIKMLFRPYKEINLGLFKIQGLLPKRKHEIGESIAEVIQTELVSLQEILKSLDGEKIEKEMSAVIDRILEEKLQSEITRNFPPVFARIILEYLQNAILFFFIFFIPSSFHGFGSVNKVFPLLNLPGRTFNLTRTLK